MIKFKNGEELIITTESHFHDDADIDILKLAAESIITKGLENIKKETQFIFNIGTTNVVQTDPEDKIVWARRKGRKKFSRFVMNKFPKQTNFFTVVAKKIDNNVYKLITCYRGKLSPPELKPTGNSDRSIIFWKKHAFAFGSEEIEGEILSYNPYKFSTDVL